MMTEFFQRKVHKVKNVHSITLSRDFSYNAFSYLILAVFLGMGVAWQVLFHPETDMTQVVKTIMGGVIAGGILTIFPLWSAMIQLIVLAWVGMFAFLDTAFTGLIAMMTVGLILSSAMELVYHWDKVVILRLGRFRTVRGPGLFMLLPLLERSAAFIDTRIRVTDFSAESAITCDTVPVNVDALAFWMIWDAKKAILEVEDFAEAVVLSAQTALRDSIGKHDLAVLLAEREKLGHEIQKILDAKTNPWGISILSVEFTDIVIPKELQDAMSRRAQAERERQSRIILGSAEIEVAKQFEEASKSYEHNPTALQLRAMNMVYEGIRQKSSLMILPSSALDQMNLGTVLGSAALGDRLMGQRNRDPENGSGTNEGTAAPAQNDNAALEEGE